MNVLVICNHYPVASGRYITDAFRRLGHSVRHTGADMRGEIWGLSLAKKYWWTPDTIEDGWMPELVVVADSDPAILDGLANAPFTAPMAVWAVDNHVRAYRRRYFKHYFRAHRNVSVEDWYELPPGDYSDARDVTHLPCCYDPTLHTASPTPYSDRQYDVAILGYMYPQRMAAVKELQAAGLKVIWGCGLVGHAYTAAHHNARVSLCLSARGDVAQRIFESAAMGCAVLSDPCPDFDILQPEGITVLDMGKSLVEQVRVLLEQPAVAETAIAKAQAWVQSHTWDERAKTVLSWYQEAYGEPTAANTHP